MAIQIPERQAVFIQALLLASYSLFVVIFSLGFWQLRHPTTPAHWSLCLLYLLPWLVIGLTLSRRKRPALLWLSLIALGYLAFSSIGLGADHPAKYWYLAEVVVLAMVISLAMTYLRITRKLGKALLGREQIGKVQL